MTIETIQAIQRKVGAEPDGDWGPLSTRACQDYLRKLMPRDDPFPKEVDVMDYYGPHGVEGGYTPPLQEISLPFVMYYEGHPMRSLKVHEKCALSLQRTLVHISDEFPGQDRLLAAGLLNFDGIYNPRRKRGSASSWSMHAWAIAIDINAAHNGNHTHWPRHATMPLAVMECFARNGWMSAGAFWSRDAMHFQATSPE